MMKKKAIASLIVAVLMAVTAVLPAFAAADWTPTEKTDKYSIVVKNENDNVSIVGKTYSAYKVFDMTYTGMPEATSSNATYDYRIAETSPFYSTAGTKAVIDAYFDLTKTDTTCGTEGKYWYNVKVKTGKDTSAEMRKFADELFQAMTTAATFTADATATGVAKAGTDPEKAEIKLTTPGYYLVSGDAEGNPEEDENTETVVAAVILDSADNTKTIQTKADAPSISKQITKSAESTEEYTIWTPEGEGKTAKAATAAVGATLEFQIDSEVPGLTAYMHDAYSYKKDQTDVTVPYKVVITDTISKGLTLNNETFKVTVGTQELIKDAKTNGYTYNETKTGDVVTGFTITIADLTKITGVADDADITVTYKAKHNKEARDTAYETNKVKLTYAASPYDASKTATTVEDTVYVYVYAIDIKKYSSEDTATKATLAGASFVLYRMKDSSTKEYFKTDATTKEVSWGTMADADVLTSGSDQAVFKGLKDGTYYLHETEAPAGYALMTSDVTIEATAEATDDGTGIINKEGATEEFVTSADKPEYTYTEEIPNTPGKELPSTGGMGTTVFYIVGALMAAAAAVLLIAKRNKA